MLLSVVTDDELFASQIVKTIFIIILSIGIFFNLIRFFKNKVRSKKIINIIGLLILSTVVAHVIRIHRQDGSLLHDALFTTGTTLSYCSEFSLGAGVEFEYEVDGKKFRNCNTFHPVARESITVPNGKYLVRYSPKYPDHGRMNFLMNAEK